MSCDTVIAEIERGKEILSGRRFPLGRLILIGRSANADIPLDACEISRQHARLELLCEGARFEDLSLNGATLAGQKLESGAIVPYGERLKFGPFSLRLCLSQIREPVDLGALRQRVLEQLVERVELEAVGRQGPELWPRVEAALERLLAEHGVPAGVEVALLVAELRDEALGFGPLEPLLTDPAVTEIMVVDHATIFAERAGRIEHTERSFSSEKAVRTVIERIITPLGRRIDESSPMVDARLPDGSRVNAIIPPLAIRGACLTIRKFPTKQLTMNDLVRFGTLTAQMAALLCEAVRRRQSIIISGGTGSGKTTLLNVLCAAIPSGERVVTVEDAAELRLPQPHVVSLETRPANAEGHGAITIRDLVRNALRMRPDRIVVGECRGGEALDMLQAMNTGHDGSLTTLHANSPREAIARLETLCLMAGLDLPTRAVREQIAGAVDLVIQQSRLPDGARRVTSIAEIVGLDRDGAIRVAEIYRYLPSCGPPGAGSYESTGWVPSFLAASIDALSAPEVS